MALKRFSRFSCLYFAAHWLPLFEVRAQWRRGNPLPGLLLVSTLLVLPLFNRRFSGTLHVRYLMPLLPILYAAVGALGAGGLGRLGSRGRLCQRRRNFDPPAPKWN